MNAFLASLNEHNPGERLALIVKAADRLANLTESSMNNQSMLERYSKEHEAFTKAVFRDGLCNEIWHAMDVILGIIAVPEKNS